MKSEKESQRDYRESNSLTKPFPIIQKNFPHLDHPERSEGEHLLKEYVCELLKWNKGMNLIGKSTESNILQVHINDSLELLPYLKTENISNIIDIGSGGGLPAIPLSIFLPEKKFYLTEVDSKKTAFLEFVTKKLSLNTEIVDINRGFYFQEECLIISRAFSEIKNILNWADVHTAQNRGFYLLKGRKEIAEKELIIAKVDSFKLFELDRGCIVKIKKV